VKWLEQQPRIFRYPQQHSQIINNKWRQISNQVTSTQSVLSLLSKYVVLSDGNFSFNSWTLRSVSSPPSPHLSFDSPVQYNTFLYITSIFINFTLKLSYVISQFVYNFSQTKKLYRKLVRIVAMHMIQNLTYLTV